MGAIGHGGISVGGIGRVALYAAEQIVTVSRCCKLEGYISRPKGSTQIRIRASSKTTTHPRNNNSSIAGRFSSRSASCLSGLPVSTAPEEDQRRLTFSAQCQNGPKIGVGQYSNSILNLGASENLLVLGRLQAVLAHMNRVMPALAEPLCDNGRKRVVHEESHGTASGSSRSRTASAASLSASRISSGSRSG